MEHAKKPAKKKEIIVAITGASGSAYAKRLIEELYKSRDVNTYVLVSNTGKTVYRMEIGQDIEKDLPESIKIYNEQDFSVPFISGSHMFYAMVVVPCSMSTLASIAHGTGINIIHRTADVCLKEKRKLILVPRETPLNMVHLKNMMICAGMGATIMPAMPGFYNAPKTVSDIVNFMVSRIMDHLEITHDLMTRWKEPPPNA